MADQERSSDSIDVIFARRLRKIRLQGDITQQQVAEIMTTIGHKLHRSAIAKIENGDRPVTIGEAVALAKVVGVNLDELLFESFPESSKEANLRTRYAEAMRTVDFLEHQRAEAKASLNSATMMYQEVCDELAVAKGKADEIEFQMARRGMI